MTAATLAPASAATPEDAAAPPAAVAGAPVVGDNYVLGAGDRVRVIVFGEQQLTGEFFVSPQGTVSYPLVGDIPATGRTLPQFVADLTARLKEGFVNEPRVSAEVLNYRPFYILGEVTKPGTYPYTSDMTVMNAVATAGGFTYRANKRRVFIKRAGEASEKSLPLKASTMVAPGDTVRIGERFF
ncbi:MAG: polysaccharide biosynthesis/export family protein [Hyphomonadaceae bacterium]